MRIIAGKYRGRRLAAVPKNVRPSSDRLRETLFNVLGDSVRGSVWLDPFAGSGAVGIEALSRGAHHVILNDKSARALAVVQRNLEICQVEGSYEIYQLDVFVLLKKLEAPPLDFVFLDPPYDFGRHEKLLKAVGNLAFLKAGGQIIVEAFKKTKLDFVPGSLTVSRVLRVGDSQLVFLRRRE